MYRVEAGDDKGACSLYIDDSDHPVASIHKAHNNPGFTFSINVRGPIGLHRAPHFINGLAQLLIFSGLETPGVFDIEDYNESSQG
jgi:hypothetical protein